MSPEAVDYLGTAERALIRARRSFAAEIYEAAAREAYVAALNAARAVIFDRTQIAPKSHSGARTQFFLLIQHGLEFDRELANFLTRGFEIKQRVDYGPVIEIDAQDAANYLERAATFVATARAVCERSSDGQTGG